MKRLCRLCQRRPALYLSRIGGRATRYVRADDDHDLCFQCVRDLKNSLFNGGSKWTQKKNGN